LKQPHQFVPVCHSNSQPCDVYSKSLTNKTALRCESCAITFHENSCREQVRDCTRFKVPKSIPLGSKVSSLANLTGSGHTKLQSSHSAAAGGGGGGTLTTFNSNSSSGGGGSSSLYYSVSSSPAILLCLEELIEYHLQFLRRLMQRQRQESIVLTIEDIM